jgi:hypothetical protein
MHVTNTRGVELDTIFFLSRAIGGINMGYSTWVMLTQMKAMNEDYDTFFI